MPEPRIALPPLDQLTPEQAAIRDAIIAGPRGRLDPPLAVWLHSPPLAERAQALGAFCRYHTSLPPRLSELAILVVGAHWRAGFEWAVHAPIAADSGVAADVIEAIRLGARPDFAKSDEAAVHDFAHSLLNTKRVPDETYARAKAELTERGVVDLVGVLGYYGGVISMTITAFRLALPDGVQDPFPEG